MKPGLRPAHHTTSTGTSEGGAGPLAYYSLAREPLVPGLVLVLPTIQSVLIGKQSQPPGWFISAGLARLTR